MDLEDNLKHQANLRVEMISLLEAAQTEAKEAISLALANLSNSRAIHPDTPALDIEAATVEAASDVQAAGDSPKPGEPCSAPHPDRSWRKSSPPSELPQNVPSS